MTSTSLFSPVIMIRFHSLILGLLIGQRVNGFCLQRTIPLSVSSSRINGVHIEESSKNVRLSEGGGCDGYPWSRIQDWVLRDSLPKFTIRIPIEQEMSSSSSTTTKSISSFVLWRSLLEDTPELSGYPIDFLQDRYKDQQGKIDEGNENATKGQNSRTATNPTVLRALPFLDAYKFSKEGISGTVHGMPGIADGSLITTPDVIMESLPKGYIQTSDGSTFFELGRPIVNEEGSPSESSWKVIPDATFDAKKGLEDASDITSNVNLNAANDVDKLLVKIGMGSGIFLAGATVINMLSHHMTVNVFWV